MADGMLDVILYGRVIARITARHDVMTLEYESDHAPPLTPWLNPKKTTVYKDKGYARGPVASYISGLLPENPADRRRIMLDTGTTGRPTPFAMIRIIGLDCPGAVSFTTPDNTERMLHDRGRLIPLSETGLGERLARLRAPKRQEHHARWSLPGAQSKDAYRLKTDRTWWIPEGMEPTNVIVKPSLPGMRDQAANETACLQAAKDSGLAAAETETLHVDGHDYVLSHRFDRIGDPDGRLERIHQFDLCQALGYEPGLKYEEDGGPTLRDMLDLAGRLDPDMPYVMLQQVMFNVMAGATDLHSKNLSIQMPPDGRYRMSPMYDVASIIPYMDDPDDPDLRFPYTVDGVDRFDDLNDPARWERYADDNGLDGSRVGEDWRLLADRVPDALADRFNASDVGETGRRRLGAFLHRMFPDRRPVMPVAEGRMVFVESYTRSDGTQVAAHWRTPPNRHRGSGLPADQTEQ